MVEDGIRGNINEGYDVYYKGKLIGYFRRRKDAEEAFQNAIEAEARKNIRPNPEAESKMADKEPETEGKKQDEEDKEQAKGRGGSPIIPMVLKNISEKHFLRYFILTAVILLILWYSGFYEYIADLLKIEISLLGLVVWLGSLLFIGYIIWGFSYGIKNRDVTAIWVAVVLIIWLWDLAPSYIGIGPFKIPIPYGGILYQGFIWNLPLGVFYTTWLSIFASSIMFALLYINMIYDIIKKEYVSVLLGFLFIVIINWIAARVFSIFPTQLTINIPLPWGNWAYIITVAIGTIFLIFLYKMYKRHGVVSPIPDFVSFLIMSFFFSFFWINNGWMANPKAVVHATYIVLFGLFYIAKEENPIVWRNSIILLLIADFYGYGLLFSSDILALQFIPMLVIAVVFYCYHKTRSIYALTTFIVVVTIILVLSLQARGYYQESSVAFTPKEGGADLKDFIGTLFGKTQELITQRIDIATAGLYRGSVEQNRYESLGVYFANIRAADPRFYTDEPITVWGTIRSKTYQDAVIINFSCYRWKDSNRIMADKIVPKIKFPIFTFEEVDTECTFFPKKDDKDKQIQPGSNTVTFSAEYNFGTDAYLKTYFIDRDRFRAYSRENVDSLTALGIKDRSPMPIFTNGPVEIGLQTGPLIAVSEGYTVNPTIGITLTNRKEIQDKDKKIITKWEGKIKNITELILLVPPGIELPNLNTCNKPKNDPARLDCPCSMPFITYDIDKCKSTCKETLLKPCDDVCNNVYKPQQTDDEATKKRIEEEKTSCLNECETSHTKCENECEFLFKGEGQQESYTGYALDIGSLEFKDLNKDIDKHRSFSCRFYPTPAVLDNTPITTRYFRLRARYNYIIENSVHINVESPPIAPSTTPEALYKTATESIKATRDLYFRGFEPDLIVAIATVESGNKHCCQPGYGGPGAKCYRSEEKRCSPDRIITSGTSIGIMQVRYDTDKVKKEVNERVSRVCSDLDEADRTIYGLECNVRVGIDILNDKRKIFGNGCKETKEYKSGDTSKYKTLINACNSCISTTGTPYYSYADIKAALRGYNGWGCDSRFDRGYVEKVINAYNKIKGGQIVDESGIKEFLSSRQGQGMIYDETSEGS